MMERYNLNLGRGFCCGGTVRKKYYFWMLCYLLLAGVVLVDGAYQIANRVAEVRDAEAMYSALRSDFAKGHEQADSPKDYLAELKLRLKTQNEKIKALQKLAKPAIPFLPVFFEAQSSLPKSVYMSKFDMSTNAVTLSFYFPTSGEKPEAFLQRWRENEALNRYLETLEVVSRVSGVEVREAKMIELSCTAALKKR